MSTEEKKPHNRIAELRKEKNLTIQQLADKIGVANGTISRYEQGSREPKLETWIKLSEFFDVPMSYLTGVSDDKIGWYDWEHNTGWSREQIEKEIHRLINTGRLDKTLDLQSQIGYAVESLEQHIPTTTYAAVNGVQSRLSDIRGYINKAFLEKKYTPLTPGSKIGVIKPGDIKVREDMDKDVYNKLIDIINNARWEIAKLHSKK